MSNPDSTQQRPPILAAAVAAWLAFLAFDFLAHAVFLATWWHATEKYWLSPNMLFNMIPVAYASFAIYAVALTWLLVRLMGPRPEMIRSLAFGASAGVLYGVTGAMGNYSVLPMPMSALIIWPVSFGVESAAAAVAASAVLRAVRPWLRTVFVFLAAVGLIIVGIALQNLWLPTPSSQLSSLALPCTMDGPLSAAV